MQTVTKIRKQKGTFVVTIPKKTAEEAGLRQGEILLIYIDERRIEMIRLDQVVEKEGEDSQEREQNQGKG